ncbi:MAG: hypothetical protein AAF197_05250 [Pseudomonadota bacterium]
MAIKLYRGLSVSGHEYRAGDTVQWWAIYPFFIIHMGIFGASGFLMAYAADVDTTFLFVHGGIAIIVYLVFYWAIFGPDTIRWLFIDTALGLFGIVAQLGWILAIFDKGLADYDPIRHVIPFIYYVLYTFLLHQAVLDFTGSREDSEKRKRVDWVYAGLSVLTYTALIF